MSEKFKEYVVHYSYQGHGWCVIIKASSFEDAEARLKAIGAWGSIEDELMATIPAVPGAGLLVRLMTWLRNLFR